jgi:hypothetical protein
MRTINYRRLDHEEETVSADLEGFLEDLPFLVIYKNFPPISALNDLLSRGEYGDSHYLVRWEPFSLPREEYDETAAALRGKIDRA